MATSLSNPLGSCSISGLFPNRPICPRFTDYLDTAAAFAGAGPGRGLQPSPGGGFPATPPLSLSGVASTIDDRLRTPYSHAINVSMARELPWDLTIEGAWVYRRGVKLPIARDYAMAADLVDPASGVSALQAARDLVAYAEANQNQPFHGIMNIGSIPYWENLFPSFGPSGINTGCLASGFFSAFSDVFGVELGPDGMPNTADDLPLCGYSATQVAYDYMMGYHGIFNNPGFGASTFWDDVDRFQFPAMMNCPQGTDTDGDGFPDCRFAFFPGQFVQLSGLTGLARSEYNAFQFSLRKRQSHGLLFNMNYTLSTSKDHSSAPERLGTGGAAIGAGYSGYMLNSWDISQQWGYSDYDMRHQFNSHVVYELPVGRGKAWGSEMPGWANQVIGGWALSGIFRFNSALPLTVINGRTWPTNWNFQGNAVCHPAGGNLLGLGTGPCPPTQNVKAATHSGATQSSPNAWADPDTAFAFFRFGAPGESGNRNVIRGDKYINLDFGIAKSFNMPFEGHKLEFRWDMFNLFNSAYFDTGQINASSGDQATFGDYTAVLGGPRRMQLQLRYEF
jgi:hypothetical protein